jgi:hypothetical protein
MRYLWVLLLVACQHEVRSGEPAPVIRPQPADKCGAACARMALLSCEEASPVTTDAGTISCEEMCRYLSANGVALDLDCVSTVASCVEIDTKCNP